MSTAPLYPLWDPALPLPPHTTMADPDIVTHIMVERAQPAGFHYLHESSLAWHQGALYLCWANHPTVEINTDGELVRGRVSTDGGYTWGPAETWAEAPMSGAQSYNHPVIASDGARLWGFFTRWDDAEPTTAIFRRDNATGAWQDTGGRIPHFLTFRPPMRLPDGQWIISGEHHWEEAAVAISAGDWTHWDSVEIPRNGIDLLFPETTLMVQGEQLVAIMRPRVDPTAPVSCSANGGRTWTPMTFSNFPMAWSMPFCGMLSTGQQYLLSNHREEGRFLLSIAVTAPGGTQFCRIWKVRHQQYPLIRLFGGWGGGSRVGQPTEWSYPAAVEHDGKLYVSYTQGKEDCVLSIIPLSALQVSGE